MDIEIRHCNNIERARITLTADKLNIKFAPNGTGKSTLSRAISYAARDDSQGLQTLMPFRLRGENPGNAGPVVTGAEGIGEVMCFNEEYVDQFTFQPNELINDSFNILIRNEAHAEREREIEEMTQAIRAVFTDHTELNLLTDHLQELSSAFRSTSSGISRSSTGMKGLSGGNKIQHIPAGLESYEPYIRSERRVEWIDWQTKGLEFLQICKSITASADCEEIIKLIYLRRYFEIVDERGDAYQLLSNLFHRRVVPLDHREPAAAGAGYPEMEPEKIQQARRDIREYVASFDYPRLQALVSSPDEIKNLYRRCRNGYEKLQVFRLLELDQDHPVIRKFVNETYHIENEFICQLDPSRFDLIPEYVILECDKLIDLPPAANQSPVARTA